MKNDEKKIKLDGSSVRELAEILNETGLTEIEYEDQGRRIRVVKGSVSMAAPSFSMMPMPSSHDTLSHSTPSSVTKDATKQPITGHVVRSPMVGTAYLSSEPGSPNFVKVGDRVSAGQTLLIIEAMKVMNPIKAPSSGVVKSISVENASPVEFDEQLIIIE